MNNETKMRKMSFYADATKTGLSFIQIPMDESRGIIMLVDTGSNDNIMFGYAYKELKVMMKEEESKSYLYGIDGKQTLMNHASGVFSICGMNYNMKFLIREDDEAGLKLSEEMGFPICGIIGTRFMTEHGWILDFAKQEVIISDADGSLEELKACAN